MFVNLSLILLLFGSRYRLPPNPPHIHPGKQCPRVSAHDDPEFFKVAVRGQWFVNQITATSNEANQFKCIKVEFIPNDDILHNLTVILHGLKHNNKTESNHFSIALDTKGGQGKVIINPNLPYNDVNATGVISHNTLGKNQYIILYACFFLPEKKKYCDGAAILSRQPRLWLRELEEIRRDLNHRQEKPVYLRHIVSNVHCESLTSTIKSARRLSAKRKRPPAQFGIKLASRKLGYESDEEEREEKEEEYDYETLSGQSAGAVTTTHPANCTCPVCSEKKARTSLVKKKSPRFRIMPEHHRNKAGRLQNRKKDNPAPKWHPTFVNPAERGQYPRPIHPGPQQIGDRKLQQYPPFFWNSAYQSNIPLTNNGDQRGRGERRSASFNQDLAIPAAIKITGNLNTKSEETGTSSGSVNSQNSARSNSEQPENTIRTISKSKNVELSDKDASVSKAINKTSRSESKDDMDDATNTSIVSKMRDPGLPFSKDIISGTFKEPESVKSTKGDEVISRNMSSKTPLLPTLRVMKTTNAFGNPIISTSFKDKDKPVLGDKPNELQNIPGNSIGETNNKESYNTSFNRRENPSVQTVKEASRSSTNLDSRSKDLKHPNLAGNINDRFNDEVDRNTLSAQRTRQGERVRNRNFHIVVPMSGTKKKSSYNPLPHTTSTKKMFVNPLDNYPFTREKDVNGWKGSGDSRLSPLGNFPYMDYNGDTGGRKIKNKNLVPAKMTYQPLNG